MSLMMQELLYAPEALQKVLTTNLAVAKAIAERVQKENISLIYTAARGTSNNAAAYFKYICSLKTGIAVSKFDMSLATKYQKMTKAQNALIIGISQSGQSTDVIKTVQAAKEKGAVAVAVTNNPESELAKLSDYHLFLNCGEEKSVAATKTFTLQVANLSLLASLLAQEKEPDFEKISKDMTLFSQSLLGVKELAEKTKDMDNIIILSRGEMLPIAEELGLKLMETSYKLTKCYSVAEFAHGPYALIEKERVVIMLAPDGIFNEDFELMASRLKGDGAKIILFTDIQKMYDNHDEGFLIPYKKDSQALLFINTIQAFAAYVAEACGKDPDKPRGLKKVTLTI
jgi:glucosamine--fructose-6-phosphate aminotransferase (isomerizing)